MTARDRVNWVKDITRVLGPQEAYDLIAETLRHDAWVAANRHTEGLRHRVHEDIPVTPEEEEFLNELSARHSAGTPTLHQAKRESQTERLERLAKAALDRGVDPEEVSTTPPTADPHYALPTPGGRHDKRPYAVGASPEESADNNLATPGGVVDDLLLPVNEEINKAIDDTLDAPARPMPRLGHARMTDAEKTEALRGFKRLNIADPRRPSAGMGRLPYTPETKVGGGDSIPPQYRPTKQREGDQALPVKNDSTPIQHLVLKDILERMDVGFKRYGTYLQANNGRKTLQDAYEEALDLAIYLRQLIEETPGASV